MTINHVFAGVPVTGYAAALTWYERLLGRPADFFPNDTEAVWQLGAAAWIYVVTDRERAGKALLTLIVDDLERLVAELGPRAGSKPERCRRSPQRHAKADPQRGARSENSPEHA